MRDAEPPDRAASRCAPAGQMLFQATGCGTARPIRPNQALWFPGLVSRLPGASPSWSAVRLVARLERGRARALAPPYMGGSRRSGRGGQRGIDYGFASLVRERSQGRATTGRASLLHSTSCRAPDPPSTKRIVASSCGRAGLDRFVRSCRCDRERPFSSRQPAARRSRRISTGHAGSSA